ATLQELRQRIVVSAGENVNAVIGCPGECLAVYGDRVGIVGAGIGGVAEAGSDLLRVIAGIGGVVVGDVGMISTDGYVGMPVVGADGMRDWRAVIIGGGDDDGQNVHLALGSERPHHGLIAGVVGIMGHV